MAIATTNSFSDWWLQYGVHLQMFMAVDLAQQNETWISSDRTEMHLSKLSSAIENTLWIIMVSACFYVVAISLPGITIPWKLIPVRSFVMVCYNQYMLVNTTMMEVHILYGISINRTYQLFLVFTQSTLPSEMVFTIPCLALFSGVTIKNVRSPSTI